MLVYWRLCKYCEYVSIYIDAMRNSGKDFDMGFDHSSTCWVFFQHSWYLWMKARMFAWELPKFKLIYCHHPVLFLEKVNICTRSMCIVYIYQFVVGCINLIFGLLRITIYIYIPEEQSYSFHRPLEGHNLAIFQVMNTGASDLKRKHDFFCEGVDKLQGVGWGLPLGRRWSLKSQCSSSRCAGHGPGFLGHH